MLDPIIAFMLASAAAFCGAAYTCVMAGRDRGHARTTATPRETANRNPAHILVARFKR